MHGDAAVIAQGIVAEVLNLSQLEGYRTGGTIHVVVNNLVGFTTGAADARSTEYCTDIALMVEAPVFHVNGEDPEAVVAVAQLVVEYRQKFKKDVFIDLVCFRRYGHNETDEPSFTQPVLAALIARKPGVLTEYAQHLTRDGLLTEADVRKLRDPLIRSLEEAQARAKTNPRDPNIDPGSKRWIGYGGAYSFEPVKAGVSESMLQEVCAAWSRVPEGFHLNPKLTKLMAERANLLKTRQLSYGDAESLAIGTLLLEGHGVRLSGQDSRRGTFSHRHAVLRDAVTEEPYTPLNNMRPIAQFPDDAGKPGPDGRPTQGKLCVYDSPLSEAAVLGFDYGYSLADPRMVVMWEAQFGDFCNGAQVMIDQYLASAECKWERWSGLILLLPHGYEGAGPEHSSARLERFLQLCAGDNMEIVNPTTAAQAFHMLRRQVRRNFRKPLIVMTPKSLLRVPTSTVDELISGRFHEIIDDPAFAAGGKQDRSKVTTVLLCSGKVYYDLEKQRSTVGRTDTAIVRVEQLYPFHTDLMASTLASYAAAERVVWVQEEPRNAGAYQFIAEIFRTEPALKRELEYIGRPAAASPAVASKHKHKEQQHRLVEEAIPATAGAASASAGRAPGGNGVSSRAIKPPRTEPKPRRSARR
jgi:2-oxoglutarate dehydrogenase E1 component